jgi:N6-adenosine-specific RNA methylase IME4
VATELTVIRNEVRLINFDRARQALEEAHSFDEVKQIRDQAEAIRAYIKQQKGSLIMQNQAAEIKIRAERRAGEMLGETEKQHGARPADNFTGLHDVIPPPTLKELGISEIQSHRWQTMADVPEERVEQLIEEVTAAQDELTSKAIYNIAQKIKHEVARADKVSKPLPTGIWNVIYADPPWKYENSGFEMSANKHYEVMDLWDIKALPVKEHAAENSVLFLWSTNPMLKDALEVIEAWGFEYKTNFVWVKNNFTAGFYLFGKHELLLISARGSLLPSGTKPMSVISAENDIHSKKPEQVYKIIEAMYPHATKCELFARDRRQGWEAWGNEV